MDLIDYMTNEFPNGPKLTKFKNKSIVRRRNLPKNTRCAKIRLVSGTVAVQHAPDFYCSPENLARMLLEAGDGREPFDKGTKIIHLVRNPFSMAVSNYHYHAQEVM